MTADIIILPTVRVERCEAWETFSLQLDAETAAQLRRCAADAGLTPEDYLVMMAVVGTTWPKGGGK